MRIRFLLALVTAIPLLAGAQGPEPDQAEHDRAWEIIRSRLAQVSTSLQRGAVLCDLAWPDEPGDLSVQALARRTIVEYSVSGYAPMRLALGRVKLEHRGDVVQALIEARASQTSDVPQEFLIAMDDALWVGSTEARRLAIRQLGLHRNRPSIPAIIDSALEAPELTEVSVRALGEIAEDEARFYLAEVLHDDVQGQRANAAVALARIGGRSLEVLRDASRSGDAPLRLAAIRALIPVASPDDLSALYTYVADHPDDDPATLEAARTAAQTLEEILEAHRAAEAASAGSDF